jgi:hypothetical protein
MWLKLKQRLKSIAIPVVNLVKSETKVSKGKGVISSAATNTLLKKSQYGLN